MHLISHRPVAPLDGYIERFWWSHRDVAQCDGEHMLPSGAAQWVFALHDSPLVCRAACLVSPPIEWSRGVLHGPQSRYYFAGPKPRGAVVGVAFKPAGATALLGVPADELAERHIGIEELWGERGRLLHEEILSAMEPAAIFKVLERALLQQLARPLLIHPAIAQALRARDARCPPQRVSELQRQAGYSARHFIALFRSAVGLTPKHYFRVQRFNAVVKQLAGASRQDLASLAASVGYADQSHMSREFLEFAGVSPTRFRPRAPDSFLHHRIENALQPTAASLGKKTSRRGLI